ncbi:MAG: sigma-54-dependent Fis family transcriptional regulator [Holophagales bacterium]|nr:sigma-54-dependent Fis family transcriptional regulator [Holophagales bacterium]MBK9965035.1 sigma-54-dependent Fis family transcriptional regulator [Holophagales bacterium]
MPAIPVPPPLKVAVINDDPGVRALLTALLRQEGAEVSSFGSPRVFLDDADTPSFDLILSGLLLPVLGGLELLREVRGRSLRPRFVIMATKASVETAVQAMKEGASDFLVKPFEPEELLHIIRDTAAGSQDQPETDVEKDRPFAIGRSAVWLRLLERARRVAPLLSSVLLRGETGTGKDVLARYIASFGPRASRPFVALNCAALPDSLVESELFGHARGSFTGAAGQRSGLFEEADTGTLFLDEIGALPLNAQAKVLRVLEDRAVRRIGENKAAPVDVRIISATNVDLESAVSRNEFRGDLYYRLNVVSLSLPPLRERPEDVQPLAEHFLADLEKRGLPGRRLSPEALAFLVRYPFPGNVRELRHALEQAVAFSDADTLGLADFDFLKARADVVPQLDKGPEEEQPSALTQESLRDAMKKTGGNRVKAARLLGISRSSFYRLLRQLPHES